MTTAPLTPFFGQVLGQAARASGAVLERLLAEHERPFPEWAVLRTVAASGTPVDDGALRRMLVAGGSVDDAGAAAVLQALEDRGWISEATGARTLLPAGQAEHDRLAAAIQATTDRLYGDVPEADLAVARRVLELVTVRAAAAVA